MDIEDPPQGVGLSELAAGLRGDPVELTHHRPPGRAGELHTLRILVLGEGSPKATGVLVSIDPFAVVA